MKTNTAIMWLMHLVITAFIKSMCKDSFILLEGHIKCDIVKKSCFKNSIIFIVTFLNENKLSK